MVKLIYYFGVAADQSYACMAMHTQMDRTDQSALIYFYCLLLCGSTLPHSLLPCLYVYTHTNVIFNSLPQQLLRKGDAFFLFKVVFKDKQ